jgi:glyoxylate reductase
MTQKKILLSRIFPELGAQMMREAGFSVTILSDDVQLTQQNLILAAKQHDAMLCTLSDKLDTHFFKECSHLEVISQYSVGFDNVDLISATKLGIPIGHTPDVLTDATADVAFGLMIATSRKMFFMHKRIMDGKWTYYKPKANLGIELKNRTLGVFGLGRIGIEMAKRCKGAYNMNVIYNNRTRNLKAEKELGATYVDFDELLEKSDVVSLHCALTDETKGVFDKSAFHKMKSSAIFINTSRGLVHNEVDLIEALEKKEIWGAGLDVCNPEPMLPDNPLLKMENVSVLPHIGSATVETRDEMIRIAANNIISFYQNRTVPHVVNPEVLDN